MIFSSSSGDEGNDFEGCSVVTPVNHEHPGEGIRNTPLVVVARFESLKLELSFVIRWIYLNGTTPHLVTRIPEANPIGEFESQSADRAIQVLKCGQSHANPKARTSNNPNRHSTTWWTRYQLSQRSKFI